MSYGDEAPPKWSECSRKDLRAHYNQVLNVGLKWCLKAADSDMGCGGNCGSSGKTGKKTLPRFGELKSCSCILLLLFFMKIFTTLEWQSSPSQYMIRILA